MQELGKAVGLALLKSSQSPPPNSRKGYVRTESLTDEEVTAKLVALGWYKLYLEGDSSKIDNAGTIQDFLYGDSRGMFIYGNVGVGKSTLMGSMAKWFIKNFTCSPHFISTARLFDTIFERDWEKVNQLMEAPILFLDDIGVEYATDFPLGRFNSFMEHRYANLLVTFITSNLNVEGVASKPGFERIADRINDPRWMAHYLYAGESKRKRSVQQ